MKLVAAALLLFFAFLEGFKCETWQSDFESNNFADWKVQQSSWIIEKWEDLEAKYQNLPTPQVNGIATGNPKRVRFLSHVQHKLRCTFCC